MMVSLITASFQRRILVLRQRIVPRRQRRGREGDNEKMLLKTARTNRVT
jgi:hypothetical protein